VAVRRVGGVLVLVLAATTAACGVRPVEVPGTAAPITATASASPAPAPTATPTAPGTGAPAVPDDVETLTMSGFGVTVALPVPAGWTRTPSSSGGLTRTDVDLQSPQVMLRVDLSARGTGSAADGAVRNEAATTLPDYRRLGITPVPGVGDDAADWAFTFVRDGPRQVVDRQILAGTAVIAVYYSAPTALYQRYLPVWQRAVTGLTITTS
jgi:hypothetical protein